MKNNVRWLVIIFFLFSEVTEDDQTQQQKHMIFIDSNSSTATESRPLELEGHCRID